MTTETTIALVSVIIAGVALILSFVSQILAWIDRRLNRSPHLRIWLGAETGGMVSFGIANDGGGAAKIERFEFTVDGEVTDFQTLFTAVFGAGKTFTSHRLAPPPVEIGAESSVEMFRISMDGMAEHQLMHEFARRVGVNISARPIGIRDKRTDISLERITK